MRLTAGSIKTESIDHDRLSRRLTIDSKFKADHLSRTRQFTSVGRLASSSTNGASPTLAKVPSASPASSPSSSSDVPSSPESQTMYEEAGGLRFLPGSGNVKVEMIPSVAAAPVAATVAAVVQPISDYEMFSNGGNTTTDGLLELQPLRQEDPTSLESLDSLTDLLQVKRSIVITALL